MIRIAILDAYQNVSPEVVDRSPLAGSAEMSVWSSPTGAKGYTNFPAYETPAANGLR